MGKEKSWSDRIEELVRKYGSPETVAGRLGVSFFTVLRWREGQNKPSKLAQARIEELEKEEAQK